MRFYTYTTLLVVVLLIGCASQQTTTPVATSPSQPVQPTQPTTETAPSEPGTPSIEEASIQVEIPNDIKEILEKGKTRLTSYSYNYKSAESDLTYEIYIKGNNIKIILPERNTKEQGKFYNTIYFDTEKKTAEAHCIGYSDCDGKVGKIKDLDYEETHIETPLDWLTKVTVAEKIDERQVEGRDSLYLETNIGKIIVESYYGFLYKIEDGKDEWQFTDAAFNSVKDSDVTPS